MRRFSSFLDLLQVFLRKAVFKETKIILLSDSPKEYYKRALAIPLLDILITKMNESFLQTKNIFMGFLVSVLSVIVNDEDPSLANLLHWEQKLPFHKSLPNEMERWKRLWQMKQIQKETYPIIYYKVLLYVISIYFRIACTFAYYKC